jgi:APA family basic amino acid/polyamine antiporter
LTLLNCAGARTAGGFQAFTTILKLLPLGAVLVVAAIAFAHAGPRLLLPFHSADIHFDSITSAATLTLWALLGFESATVPANKVMNPARTIPRATLVGTSTTGVIYLVVCSAVLLMLPAAELHHSAAPLSDFLDRFWGGHSGGMLAVFATISSLGALIGWVFLQGELACLMAVRGVFPQWLAHTTANGTPVRAHLVSSAILTVLVATSFNRAMVDLFTFVLLLATTGCLFAYLFTALAAIKLQWQRRLERSSLLMALAIVGSVYSLWTIWGAGREAALWGLAAFLIAFPIYAAMRWSRRFEPSPAGEVPAGD